MVDIKLSANFSRDEFACHHCGEVIVVPKLVNALQELRDVLGTPIIITCGYRCPEHNAELVKTLGAAANSYHMQGVAADCTFPTRAMFDVVLKAMWVEDFMKGGIGIYPKYTSADGKVHGNFIHLDVRGTVGGKVSRWGKYKGKYIPYQDAINLLGE